jgi:hypothetical protein
MIEVLEDRPNEDAVLQELRSIIGGMSEDEQIDLVALGWGGAIPGRRVGRNCAAKRREHTTGARLHTFWRCRFYLPTFRTVSRNLASRPRTLSKESL